MTLQSIKKLLDELHLPYTSEAFLKQVFHIQTHQSYEHASSANPELANISAREYVDLSQRLDRTQIQQSCSVRNVLQTRYLARYLIDEEEGHIDETRLQKADEAILYFRYALGPERQHDAKRRERIATVIRQLRSSKELRNQINRLTRPSGHRLLDQIIRDTLQLKYDVPVTDAHARQAALSALFCYLRQNVGSCFATAPAIIIQTEHPEQFLRDLDELFSTGRLRRTVSGKQYSAPVSHTWGAGSLRRPFACTRDVDHETSTIWHSPGLAAAFVAVDLIDTSIPEREQPSHVKEILRPIFKQWQTEKTYVYTNTENLIRRVLLHKYSLTEEDIKAFEERPKPMIQSNLLIQVTQKNNRTASKTERCERFQTELQVAGRAFNSLTDNALLKTWEFTLASFAETKSNFSRWNLYSSLGLQTDQPGGIGHALHQLIQSMLDEANRKVQELQEDYEQQYSQLKYLEGRLRRASTEQEQKWIKVEYESKRNEFYTIEVLRNKAHRRAQIYANIYNILIDKYLELFPQYFQEVYDADLHEVDVGPYDDSPAGFRLLYKHGRDNTAVWTRIYHANEYIESLASFFTLTEREIADIPELEGLERDVGEIVTTIVSHVRTDAFLESAFFRMAQAHGIRPIKNPLQNLEKVPKKPWAYTSGGGMSNLLSCYFRTEENPTERGRWVENEMELAVFLIDLVEKLPTKTQEKYTQNKQTSMLMHSPTHAFLFKPSYSLFQQGISNKQHTYTWVRDHITEPAQQLLDGLYLDRDLTRHLIQLIEKEYVPAELKPVYRDVFYSLPAKLKAKDLRTHLLNELRRAKRLYRYGEPLMNEEEIDSFLYAHLPLTRGHNLEKRLQNLLNDLSPLSENEKKHAIEVMLIVLQQSHTPEAITASELQKLTLAILCLALGSHTPWNPHLAVAEAARRQGYALPSPLTFADTNWVTDFFAFVINPGTQEFELWCVDETGTQGHPMAHWKKWLNGTRHDREWAVYTNPVQYSP